MPTTVTEGALTFEFGDAWTVVKYDDVKGFYRDRVLKSLQEAKCTAKAVDFIARHPAHGLYFIEVKDLRGHRIENEYKDFAEKTALKVRDTLAGLVGACHMAGDPAKWRKLADKLVKERPTVVLWLEEERHPRQSDPRPKASALSRPLKSYLRWLTTFAFVANTGANPIPDLVVRTQRKLK